MIRNVQASETQKIERLWTLCFSDTQEERDGYFSRLFVPNEVWADFDGDAPVAMLQIIPTTLRVGEEPCPAGYLYGVCTHPDYRRQGRMRRLLNTAHQQMEAQGLRYAFLKPENPDVYTPFGYRMTARRRVQTAAFDPLPATVCDTPDVAVLNDLYQTATASFSHVNLRSNTWWQNAKALSGRIRVLYQNDTPAAYAVYGTDFVDELVSVNAAAAAALLGSISRGNRLTVCTPDPTGEPFAMTRPIGTAPPLPENGYLGLLFD